MSKRKKPLPPRPPPKRKSPPRPAAAAKANAAKKARRAAEQDEAPEIRVEYGPAGRETLAAIAEDVAQVAFPPEPVSKITRAVMPPQTSSPDLSFELAPAGRETLSAIVGEAKQHAPTDVRAPMTTLDYDEPAARDGDGPTIVVREVSPNQATGTATRQDPAPGGRRRVATQGYGDPADAPEVKTVRVGRDTLEALARAVAQEPAPASGVVASLEVLEMVTFVIRGDDLAALSSENLRRRFVEERLLSRLPISNMADVDRVDVTPWTVRNTVVLRVWCRLPAG